tara:strand:- start:149 stop:412 length:264 start_codon:yes stop_codon:yes gene_type:complete
LVEQAAVNRLVAGSSPARGANKIKGLEENKNKPLSPFFSSGSKIFKTYSSAPAIPWRFRLAAAIRDIAPEALLSPDNTNRRRLFPQL